MIRLTNFPLATFALTLIVLWISARAGARFAHRVDGIREDFNVILTATLTLLSLIIGFTFSMAVSRYDQRKLYEAEEANSIGTEYVRSELLSADDSDSVRRLLRDYLDERILFYQTHDEETLQQINTSTAHVKTKLWAAVKSVASPNPNPITSLFVSGMNDVLNSQGYTEAAWLNRIPVVAWTLLNLIAICANVMVGLSLRRARSHNILIAILPAIVSVSLLLIADIDSPRGGLIHVRPENLMSLARSLRP